MRYFLFAVAVLLCSNPVLSQPAANDPRTTVPRVGSKPNEVPSTLPPEKTIPTVVSKFEKPPVINGELDEEVWQNAAVLKNFYQTNPGDNTAPSVPTEVLIGYDAHNLYLGFRAHDEPGKVRATIAKRDEVMDKDDSIRILLDTFNDRRRAYVLVFNPFGIQQDGIRTEGSGVDFSVDVVMESKGVVGNDGYTVEVAIPFKSLRYEAGKGVLWGVQVFRIIQRLNGEQDSWMPLSRSNSSILAQTGHITGLEGISSEHTLELIPSLTFSEDGRRVPTVPSWVQGSAPGLIDNGRFVNEPIKPVVGLTAKFGITPTVTLDVALNPDFAQVEADQLVVTANQRFPIFFPEKRPFFLEGIEVFRTPLTALHTRSIVAPEEAVKLTGKLKRNTFGILFARDKGPGNFIGDDRLDPSNFHFVDRKATVGVLRFKHDVGQDSSLGLLATSYSFKGNEKELTPFDLITADPCSAEKSLSRTGRVGGVDGRFRLNKTSTYDFQVLGTTSQRCFYDPVRDRSVYRGGNGFAYSSVYDVTGRNWGWVLENDGRTRDYRADLGFTSRTNTNYNFFGFRYSTDPREKAKLVSWRLNSFHRLEYDFQGRLQNWESNATVYWFLQRNTNFWVSYRRGHERLFEEEFGPVRSSTSPGTFAGPAERAADRQHFIASVYTQPDKKFGGELTLAYRMGTFDYDFGGGPRFPRVSPAALTDVNAPLDPGAGNLLDLSGSAFYQPADAVSFAVDFVKNRLVRNDTKRVAFDDNITSIRGTYQFTRFLAARARLDYTTLERRARAQLLLAWTPGPGTALYAGYNDDFNRDGFNPYSGRFEPGIQRNGRTFFIKASYLFRRSF